MQRSGKKERPMRPRVPALLVCALLCALGQCAPLPVFASQITPATVDTPGGFGPAFPWIMPEKCTRHFSSPNVMAIQCPVTIPVGTVEIAGWSGYTIDLGLGQLVYASIEVWHDGGTPHLLDHPHSWTPGATLASVFYPAGDGHVCRPQDQVFARFWCVGFPGRAQPWCAAGFTGHFRVTE